MLGSSTLGFVIGGALDVALGNQSTRAMCYHIHCVRSRSGQSRPGLNRLIHEVGQIVQGGIEGRVDQ